MSIPAYMIGNCVFGFKYNASWGNMRVFKTRDEDGDLGGIRFCNARQKEVYECTGNYEWLNMFV